MTDPEEYQVLHGALGAAKTSKHQCELLLAYAEVPIDTSDAPDPSLRGHKDLLSYLSMSEQYRKSPARLRSDLRALNLQIALLEARIEDFTEREHVTVPAADPILEDA